MKKLKLNDLMNTLLIIFLIIQPIFDLKIFYNSISTLIRVIIMFALFSYYFFTSKNRKKYLLLIYPFLLGIYFIVHHLNALKFTSLVPGNFDYSIIKEFLYFVKMTSPFLLIYALFKADVSIDTIINVMKYLVLIIGLIIVVSNIFIFSYGSYSDTQIKSNFFEWFNPHSSYTYYDLASKGLFEFGNQIAAILVMFLPFMIYNCYKKNTFINWFVLCLNILSLNLLCTKVSVLGIFVVLIFSMFTFGFISFIQKEHSGVKKYVPIALLLVVNCLLLPFNPMFSRIQERATVVGNYNAGIYNENIENEQNDTPSNVVEEEVTTTLPDTNIVNDTIPEIDSKTFEMLSYIEDNYESKKLPEQFIFNNYPYKYDPEFWYRFLQNDIWLTTDYRFIELSIIQRVAKINDNNMDMWFGITNTRLQNVFNIEKDFVVQYYALGIIGTILVFAPYFILLGIFAYKTIRNKFKNLNIVNLLSGITIVFLFGISYMTGNLLNSMSFTIYFTLCFYLIIKKSA